MEMLGLKEKFGAIVLTLHKLTFKQGWESMNKKCRITTSTRGKSTTCLGLMNGNWNFFCHLLLKFLQHKSFLWCLEIGKLDLKP